MAQVLRHVEMLGHAHVVYQPFMLMSGLSKAAKHSGCTASRLHSGEMGFRGAPAEGGVQPGC